MKYSFGTDEYINDILNKYAAALIKIAFTYLKSIPDAEDIVQEVYLSLMKRGQGFETDEHEKAWLIRVTINKCKNHLRSAWIRHQAVLEDELSDQSMDSLVTQEENEVLTEVLGLPMKYRTVIHLYYYENYSIEEIAGILKRSTGTIGTWLSRGRKQLKARLNGGFEYEAR